MREDMRQMPAMAGRSGAGQGEAVSEPGSDESERPRRTTEGTGQGLLEAVLARENLQEAWKRVKANKGASGVDGLDIAGTAALLKFSWPAIRERLIAGTYRPRPVRKVMIPKPGGGERELGIPTVTDRLIQQALLQVLQPMIDPTFSEHSYGFRPGRSARDAVLAAQSHVQSGRRIVVDVDLEKFFDRVDHDTLIDRLSKRIPDRRIIRLIRAYLDSGIMSGGEVQPRDRGTPQGGPLSPLLANVLLDEVDKELERRGHAFVRYADDANVYVHSLRAGERVMGLLRRLYGRLRLTINEAKSAVASVFGRKFLGFTFALTREGHVRREVSQKALKAYRERIRELTRRTCGRSLVAVARELRPYVLGWKGYFKLAQTPWVFDALDGWMRHRLRALQFAQWRRGATIYRKLRAMGASTDTASIIAARKRSIWRTSERVLNPYITNKWLAETGVPALS